MYTHPDPENPDETLSFDLIGRGQEWITGESRIITTKRWSRTSKNGTATLIIPDSLFAGF
jgi:aspartyl/asparaginyl-tRNA synthetase